MNSNTASPQKKQAQSCKTQKGQRTQWRHVQPWQFRTDGQGRKYRLVGWMESRLAKIIGSYASKSGSCFASVKTLAAKLGRSPAQTARYLARLKEQGIIRSNGLSHKHGKRVRTLDPSGLASASMKGESRVTVNCYGSKKGMFYTPAYAPVRESESSIMRECESSTCANVRNESFLRKGNARRDRKLAVPQDAERTCELRIRSPEKSTPLEGRVDPPKSEKTPFEGRPRGLSPTSRERNLKTYMNRNGFEPVKEWPKYDSKIWVTREEWIGQIREERLNWDDACKATSYTVNYDDPFVCWEFLDIVKEVVDKHSRDAEITPAKLCMKVLDRCLAERPTVPFPPTFLAHKNKLCQAQKRAAKWSAVADWELIQSLD